MQQSHDAIRERGAQVVALGQGSGDVADRFCRELGVDFPCLGDPEKQGYRAFGLPRGNWWGVLVKPLLTDTRLSLDRIRRADLAASAAPDTDPLQMPGVAVLDRQGIVRFLHQSQRTDDFPPMSVVIEALDELNAGDGSIRA